MIAQLNIKKCPFRKKTMMVDWQETGHSLVNTIYEENFMECIEEECASWNSLKKDCRLMDKIVLK